MSTLEAGLGIPPKRARVHRAVALAMVGAPTLGTAVALVLALRNGVSPTALWLLAGFYIATMAGVEIGLHRYFSHRAFKCGPNLRLLLGILGSMAGEGPVLFWASTHRRHHRFADTEADPHSPLPSGLAGWWHAHIGWLFGTHDYAPARDAPDLARDATTMMAHRLYPAWFVLGLLLPAACGFAIGGAYGALEGLLWGGLVRAFAVHHATWSVNSLCHLVGTRPFAGRDDSRNLGLLALPTLGGAWHNNHHAFPAAATTSLGWWQMDPSGWLIRLGELTGAVWDVRRPPAKSHREAKRNREVQAR